MSIIANVGTGEDLLRTIRSEQVPDVCVLDLALPGIGGADVLRALRAEFPTVRVLIVSGAARPEIAARCLREGAHGFLSKFRSGDSFVKALSTVASGARYVDEDLLGDVLEYFASNPGGEPTFANLSAREFSVLQKLAEGKGIKDIDGEMNLNSRTVSTYRTRLLAKLNLHSNAEVTAYCLRHQLISIDGA